MFRPNCFLHSLLSQTTSAILFIKVTTSTWSFRASGLYIMQRYHFLRLCRLQEYSPFLCAASTSTSFITVHSKVNGIGCKPSIGLESLRQSSDKFAEAPPLAILLQHTCGYLVALVDFEYRRSAFRLCQEQRQIVFSSFNLCRSCFLMFESMPSFSSENLFVRTAKGSNCIVEQEPQRN